LQIRSSKYETRKNLQCLKNQKNSNSRSFGFRYSDFGFVQAGGVIASLTVKGLAKKFGDNEILKNVSFDVGDGEFCVLLGPSGCGKSTILRLIAGLEQPTGGEIAIAGERVEHLAPKDRDIAFVFQSYALYPHMTVFDNLAFALRMRGMAARDIAIKVKDAARLLEIDDLLDRRPHSLSGGQRQRVALGRAIVRQPKIFLFDEPLSNLDAALRATMRVELARLHRRLKATIIYVTHDQAEALTLGEKIIVLHQGAIQQIGSAAEIYRRPANTQVAAFVGNPRMNFLEGELDTQSGIFACGTLKLDIAALRGQSFPPAAAGPLTVGIRPEDLHLVASARPFIRGEVELVEDLGSDRFLHLLGDGVELIARAGKDTMLRRGDPVSLDVAPTGLHFFRAGKRLEL
jgi:ABC-type sugar transport system ATPase subunit